MLSENKTAYREHKISGSAKLMSVCHNKTLRKETSMTHFTMLSFLHYNFPQNVISYGFSRFPIIFHIGNW